MPNIRASSDISGDGVTADLVDISVQAAAGTSSVTVGGRVQKVGQAVQNISGSPLTFPAAPGAGIINVIIQVDYTTGIATIKQNTTAGVFPTPDANNMQIYQTVLQTTDTDLSLDPVNITPDTW